MLPLSTPETSGLWVDWLSLAVVLGGVCLFVVGLAELWNRVERKKRAAQQPIDTVTLGSYAALALVGLAVVVMFVGGPAILVAQSVFLAVAAWGLVRVFVSVPRLAAWWRSRHAGEIGSAAAFAITAIYCAWFWSSIFQDHLGLPCFADGIAHTAYYLRILESGLPTLGRVHIGFANLFGVQNFEFYPTGTHSLMAVASGFWGQWGLISQAGVLKAWFTLTVTAAPFSLYWALRRLVPGMPWWVGLAVVFVAIPGFRFPLEAAHEGGMSRLLAHVLLMPVYADVLLGRFSGWRGRAVGGIFLGLAFLMHPSAFVTFAAVLACATLFDAIDDAGWRPRVVRAGGLAVALGIAAAIAVGLLKWNASAAVARDAALPFAWPALVDRFTAGWTTLFDTEYGMGPIKAALVGLGLVLLVVRRKAMGIAPRVVALPFCMALVALAALSAQLVPFPGARLIGGAFYDEVARVIELFYETIALCLAVAMWSAWSVAAGALKPDAEGAPAMRRIVVNALAFVIVIAAAGYEYSRHEWVSAHIGHFDRRFQTARLSRLQPLGAWIMRNTERDALLFYAPFDTEIWEAWTGRRGIFMYGECHVNNGLLPCNARKELVGGRLDVLRARIDEPAPDGRCLSELDRFGRPGYLLIPTPFASSAELPLCRDATYITSLGGHAVIAYRRQ